MDATARVEAVLAAVRDGGGRATSARRAIVQSLLDHQDVHPTVEHITSAVQTSQPEVAESTVYRFLDELERLGIVQHLRLGGGPAVYHFTEDTDHHHLVCDGCGGVTEVPAQVFDALRTTLRRSYAFAIEPRHLTLPGLCAECVGRAARPAVERGRRASRDHRHATNDHTHPAAVRAAVDEGTSP